MRSGASGSLPGRTSASWSLTGAPADGLIRPRPRVGAIAAVVLAALFAAAGAAIASADRWLGAELEVGQPAPVTSRAPIFSAVEGASTGGVIVARGEIAGTGEVDLAARVEARLDDRAPLILAAALFAIGLLFCAAARRGRRGALLRAQVVVLGAVVAAMAAAQAALLLTPVSVFALPAAALAIAAAAAVEPRAGWIAGATAALGLATLAPVEAGVAAVLVAQALGAAVVIASDPRSRVRQVIAGFGAALAAAAAYAIVAAMTWRGLPPASHPGLIAAAVGGAISAPLALGLAPLLARLCGEPSRRQLARLQAFSHPLLSEIAERAPGTWVHTLAIASLAETAVDAIGGDAQLARTGAYYHDLGKSLQPKYFDENLAAGEPSPLDSLAPEIAADVIAAHVTEGVRAARRGGVPERVVDFIHMHHGGQPIGDDFHYPGLLPQTRETAVLAICDAVELAWREIHRPAEGRPHRGPLVGEIERPGVPAANELVRRVVYDKLHAGQLDESGLTTADLRAICAAIEGALAEVKPAPSRTSAQRDAATVAIRKSPAPPPADKKSTAHGHASGLDDSAREPITAALRVTRSGVPIPAPPQARPEAVIVDDDPTGDLDVTNPMSPAPVPEKPRQRGRPGPRTEQLAEWQQALSVVDDEPGASGSRSRPGPETIELLGKVPPADDELEPSSLSPGTLVIGPPPETHPLGGGDTEPSVMVVGAGDPDDLG